MSELTKDQFDGLLKGFAKTTGLEKTYTESELQEKLKQLRDICRRITNCDYYGEDGEIKGVRVPFGLLHDLEFALDNNGEEG